MKSHSYSRYPRSIESMKCNQNPIVSLRLLDPYIVMMYWFYENHPSPKSEVVHCINKDQFKDPLAHARLAQLGKLQ